MNKARPTVFAVLSLYVAFACSSAAGVVGRVRDSSSPAITEVRVSQLADLDPHDETSLAVSPKDDRIIVGVSKVIVGAGSGNGVSQVAYYFSSDGGQSWGTGLLGLATPQKTWNRSSDPSVAVDADGNFFACILLLDETSGTLDSGIYIYRSSDGGRTFGAAEPVFFDIGHLTDPKQADKCYMTIDRGESSSFKNTIHVVWVSTEPTRTVILASHRRAGETAFSEPKAISHSGTMVGPSLAVGPNGEFYAAWQGMGQPRVILFNASTDGGDTFLPPVIARPDYNVYNYVGSLTSGVFSPDLNISGVRRMNSFPVIDVDRSNGPNRGMIYIAWAETTNGRDADVFVEKITPPLGVPPGLSFRVKVNNDLLGADQFFPWLSVDNSNGAVEVAFYDRRDDPFGLMNAYLARSTDGGASFSENLRVSSMLSDPLVQAGVSGSFANPIGIGDYIGLFAANGKAHLLWTDTRGGKQEIYYGGVEFEPSGGGGGGGGRPANDTCQTPVVITAGTPFTNTIDTTSATSSPDDPQSCTGSTTTNTVWYSVTPDVDTVYGIDSAASNYDTVLSVYTGTCGSLTPVACNDNFVGTRALLTFAASSGVRYLIEASGKGAGGQLSFRFGFPTVTGIEYTKGPDGKPALRITGAGFLPNIAVTVQRDGVDTILPLIFFPAQVNADGTATQMFASKKKLKKLVKRAIPVIVTVESPFGSGRTSIPLTFIR